MTEMSTTSNLTNSFIFRTTNSKDPQIALYICMKGKRSWRKFKKYLIKHEDSLKEQNPQLRGFKLRELFDLRLKHSKPPLEIKILCCGQKLEVWHVKDFPMEDVKCKCGNYLVKWEKL